MSKKRVNPPEPLGYRVTYSYDHSSRTKLLETVPHALSSLPLASRVTPHVFGISGQAERIDDAAGAPSIGNQRRQS